MRGQCDKIFEGNQCLKINIMAVQGDITFLCYQCDKIFDGNQCLKKHIIAVKGDITFLCYQ